MRVCVRAPVCVGVAVFVCLLKEKKLMVFVEKKVADDATLTNDEAFSPICKKLCTFREGVPLTSLPSASI